MKTLFALYAVLALGVLISPAGLLACENDYVPNVKAIAASKSLVQELTDVEFVEPWSERRDRLRKEVENGADFKTRNDLAGALMHTGDAKAAVEILEEIEESNPGLYQTASNLGTAHELAGDNAKALQWIRTGIKRNPQSHQGSEWLHVKILEAKLSEKQQTDSTYANWTSTGSLLGLKIDPGTQQVASESLPKGNSGEPLTLAEVEAALKYQLRERLQFVKPKDQIVASLLFDLGNIEASKPEGPGMAQGIYELAADYAETGMPSYDSINANIRSKADSAWQANRTALPTNSTRSFLSIGPVFYGTAAICIVIVLYIISKVRERMMRQN